MKSYFIKDTDKQYSIREDGAFFSHYFRNSRYNKIIYRDKRLYAKEASTGTLGSVTYFVEGIKVQKAILKLLCEYFNTLVCIKCKEYVKVDKYSVNFTCPDCIIWTEERRKSYNQDYMINNSEKYAKYNKKSRAKNIKTRVIQEKISAARAISNLTKSYVASSMRLPVKDLPDDLYELKKIIIKTRRLCQKQRTIQN